VASETKKKNNKKNIVVESKDSHFKAVFMGAYLTLGRRLNAPGTKFAVKLSLCKPYKTYRAMRGSGGTALRILNIGTRCA
jgi:hypothetical protein